MGDFLLGVKNQYGKHNFLCIKSIGSEILPFQKLHSTITLSAGTFFDQVD